MRRAGEIRDDVSSSTLPAGLVRKAAGFVSLISRLAAAGYFFFPALLVGFLAPTLVLGFVFLPVLQPHVLHIFVSPFYEFTFGHNLLYSIGRCEEKVKNYSLIIIG